MNILDERLRALAHPVRREILQRTWTEELTAGELAAHFEISRPGVSQHVSALMEASLLRMRRAGTRRYYAADQAAVQQLRAYFDSFWEDGLDRLKAVAERDGDA